MAGRRSGWRTRPSPPYPWRKSASRCPGRWRAPAWTSPRRWRPYASWRCWAGGGRCTGERPGYVRGCGRHRRAHGRLGEPHRRRGGSVSYILVVDRRRRRKNSKSDPPPEETYIGFATSVPSIDVRVYGHRWVVEMEYSKVEAMRPRSRSKGARLFGFLYAVATFNSWVMWGALLRMSSAVRRRLHVMTQMELKVTVLDMVFAEVIKPPSRAPALPVAPLCGIGPPHSPTVSPPPGAPPAWRLNRPAPHTGRRPNTRMQTVYHAAGWNVLPCGRTRFGASHRYGLKDFCGWIA